MANCKGMLKLLVTGTCSVKMETTDLPFPAIALPYHLSGLVDRQGLEMRNGVRGILEESIMKIPP